MIQLRPMRVLLISDIHSNLAALEAVLNHAEKFDAAWCLGDIVGYGPAPNQCIQKLRDLPLTCLAGNHEWAVLEKLELKAFNKDAQHAIRWTQDVLSSQNRAWLEQLSSMLMPPDYDITLVHGSPRQPIWEYILSVTTASENLSYFDTSVCFFGHTHVPVVYLQARDSEHMTLQYLSEDKPFALAPKMLLNPGSVGQPRDRDPRAAYALLDLDARTFTYHRVAYDIAATQAAMLRADLPPRLIARLDYGV